ncbi:hypothetical protein GVAV_003534 [Gurleya vavrai]
MQIPILLLIFSQFNINRLCPTNATTADEKKNSLPNDKLNTKNENFDNDKMKNKNFSNTSLTPSKNEKSINNVDKTSKITEEKLQNNNQIEGNLPSSTKNISQKNSNFIKNDNSKNKNEPIIASDNFHNKNNSKAPQKPLKNIHKQELDYLGDDITSFYKYPINEKILMLQKKIQNQFSESGKYNKSNLRTVGKLDEKRKDFSDKQQILDNKNNTKPKKDEYKLLLNHISDFISKINNLLDEVDELLNEVSKKLIE